MMQKQNDESPAREVAHVLEVLSFQKMDDRRGFHLEGCFPGEQNWTQAALLKKEIDIEFKFSPDCDLSGKFKASYLDKIPMQLRIRNLEDYTSVKMLVKLNIKQSRNNIIYRFDVEEGTLRSAKSKLDFKAKYRIYADPLTNEVNEETEKGQILINKKVSEFKFN